jgi:ABC-type uncharacterized transport system permease subunit
MFNFLAAALLVYLLVNVLKEPGNMAPETAPSAPAAQLPGMHELLAVFGIDWPKTPLNLSVLLAGLAAWAWSGAVVAQPPAMRCARWASRPRRRGTPASRRARRSCVDDAVGCAGRAGGINELAGVQGRLLAEFVAGAGFAGIAVALIGRNHPTGIVLAALLFGALYQGGAELSFEIPGFSRDMVFMLQGLIVLFCRRHGAGGGAGAGARAPRACDGRPAHG